VTTKRFALQPGGAPRLEISWRYGFKDVVIKVDGLEIGRVSDPSELKLGREFALGDGSTLRVELVSKFHTRELRVLRNGEPLPGSSSHPQTIQRAAYGLLYAIAAFTAIFGVAAIASHNEKLGGVAGGIGMLVEAAIYALLAWRVSRRSLIALYIALVLFVADTAFSLAQPGSHGLIVRILIFIALIRGVPAIRELRLQGEPPPSVPG
jgi:hypothetical protein